MTGTPQSPAAAPAFSVQTFLGGPVTGTPFRPPIIS